MYEGFFLVVLTALVILFIRPGKKVIYDNPVVIDKDGLYHATLAPQLIRAQPFIETVASQFLGTGLPQGDIVTQYFQVTDAQGSYLLAAGFRSGILYFQIIQLSSDQTGEQAIRLFSDRVMVNIPLEILADTQGAGRLNEALVAAANRSNLSCERIPG